MIDKLDAGFFDQSYFTGKHKSHYDGNYEYDTFKESYRRVFTEIARRELGLGKKSKSILEIGASTGNIVEKLSQIPHTNATGVDLSHWALATGRQSNPIGRSNLVQAYAEQLPFPDASFDDLISLYCIEHVPNSEKLIQEFRRVLKPEGLALVMIDTVKGEDQSHVSIHSRTWWTDAFTRNGFIEQSSLPTLVSRMASVLPSWQTGHSRLNPGLYSGLFLLQKKG